MARTLKADESRQVTTLFEIENKIVLKEKADFTKKISQAVNFQINKMC